MNLKKLSKDKFIQKIHNFVTNRMFITMIMLMLQFFVYFLLFYYASFNLFFYTGYIIISIILIFYIISKKDNPSYKIAWLIIIISFPYIGIIGYFLYGGIKIPKKLRNELIKENIASLKLLEEKNNFFEPSLPQKSQFDFLYKISNYPYYQNSEIDYYDSGEKLFDQLLIDISKAEKFIFLEYFIIDKGYMLETLIKLLVEKIAQGVKVYLIYDDFGCVRTLEHNFYKQLKEIGINASVFNPITFKTAKYLNNRDHRKITVIDNKIAFMGGANIADEYINKVNRFGHWKDTGIRIYGEAVFNCTMMFIQFYNAINENTLNYNDFNLKYDFKATKELVLPFSDSPTDDKMVGRDIHLNIISRATKYIYIHTPYLILDYELTNSLIKAVDCGVEVIITTPFIPDKKSVFLVTRYNYFELIKHGVKIYEYLPGFIHSKLMICDDELALVGTINMDYRSYYLNYECATLFNSKKVIKKIKEDYINTLTKSKEFKYEDMKKINIFKKIVMIIMNIFSPLL